MAVECKKYHGFSAMTSLLIFFGTPHRASPLESAYYLMRLTDSDSYWIPWLANTAQMIHEVNYRFNDNMYQAISVFYEQTRNCQAGVRILFYIS